MLVSSKNAFTEPSRILSDQTSGTTASPVDNKTSHHTAYWLISIRSQREGEPLDALWVGWPPGHRVWGKLDGGVGQTFFPSVIWEKIRSAFCFYTLTPLSRSLD